MEYISDGMEAVLSFLAVFSVWDIFAFVFGLMIIPVFTIFTGGRLGTRTMVLKSALFSVDRWIGIEKGNRITFHEVREKDPEEGLYEANIDGEWTEIKGEDRWKKLIGCWFGITWDKSQKSLEGSGKGRNESWARGEEYTVDASKELSVMRDSGDPRLLDDIQEDVLVTDGGGQDTDSLMYKIALYFVPLFLGSGSGLVLVMLL